MAVRISFRRATTALWTLQNPILGVGEPAFDITRNSYKIGDGVTPWVDLVEEVMGGGGGSGSGDVVGPNSALDEAIARFNSVTGKIIQNSSATLSDAGDITAGKYNSVTISGSSAPELSVTGAASISGTNTGDQILPTLGSLGAVSTTDPRLSDSRLPTSHATSHNTGGGDAITALNAGVLTSGTLDIARLGVSGTPNGSTYLRGDNTWATVSGGGGGTVNSVGITGANGIGVSGSPITDTGSITLSLGAITPTSVSASGTVTGSNLSGTNTGDQTLPTLGSLGAVPTSRTIIAGTGLTGGGDLTTNRTLSVDSVQSIGTLSNLTTNGFVKTTTGTGALSVDTSIYLTDNQSITLSGDVTGSGTTSITGTVARINGVALSGLGTGILKNTTGTGVPSIAIAADFPILNQNTTGSAATVLTNADLIGPVTSVGNTTSIANGAITNAMLANSAVANLSGTNTGDQTLPTRASLGISNVENTALSTWVGSTNITTLGTIATGTWNATAIADNRIASALTGKTYNALTLTANATGFSVAGGTTSKTLTVTNSLTLAGNDSSTLDIGIGGILGTAAFTSSGTYLTSNQNITLSGDVTGSGTTSIVGTVSRINNVALSGLSTGILKNTTGTGVPSIAIAADFPILNQNTTGTAAAANLAASGVGGVTGTLPVANGGTGIGTFAVYAPIFGGTTGTGVLQSGTAGTSNQILSSNGVGSLPTFKDQIRTITFGVGDGINVPSINTQERIRIPFNGTITKVTIVGDVSGSAVVDIWKDSYANYPPTIADTITASAPPTLSSVIKNEDSTLTGWTTSISSGDFLIFNLNSVTTCKKITVFVDIKLT